MPSFSHSQTWLVPPVWKIASATSGDAQLWVYSFPGRVVNMKCTLIIHIRRHGTMSGSASKERLTAVEKEPFNATKHYK